MNEQHKVEVPPGYRADAQGRFVPEAQIRPIDLARDELVQSLIARAKPLRQRLSEFRQQGFEDIQAFVELSVEEYGAKLGGTKGNVTLYSYDGRFKILRAIADAIVFDERLLAAKALIDECLRDWTAGVRPEVATLVQDAFRADGSGNIRTGSVLGLRRLNISDERWDRAMKAISEAVSVVSSKQYLRFYERDAKGEYQPISLDIASAQVPPSEVQP